MHWWITETSWTLEMAGTSEKREHMLKECIGSVSNWNTPKSTSVSYEFHRQKVKAMTERTAADIRQRERAKHATCTWLLKWREGSGLIIRQGHDRYTTCYTVADSKLIDKIELLARECTRIPTVVLAERCGSKVGDTELQQNSQKSLKNASGILTRRIIRRSHESEASRTFKSDVLL